MPSFSTQALDVLIEEPPELSKLYLCLLAIFTCLLKQGIISSKKGTCLKRYSLAWCSLSLEILV